ncbi:MAG: transporter substrate-binding domain-containing protein [Pseudanabaena sp. ELA607]
MTTQRLKFNLDAAYVGHRPKYWALLAMGALALVGCQTNPPAAVTPTPKPTASPTTKTTEGTLERVKNRNKLICGVNGRLPGFSLVTDKGEWSGLDVDYCRAIAGAVLGDANAIELRSILPKDRFLVLQSGDVDIVLRNTPRTLTRDTQTNIAFGPTIFFDGQGLMQRIAPKPSPTPASTATPTASVSPSPTATPSPIPIPSPSSTDSKSSSNPTTSSNSETAASLSEVFKDIADKRICVETGNSATTLETAFANRANNANSTNSNESKNDNKSDNKTESKTDSKSDLKTSEPSSDSKTDAKSDSKSDPKSESKTEPKTDSGDKKLNLVILPDLDNVITAYNKGECDVVSGSKSQLAAWRSKLPKPSDHKILDVSFDQEPLSPIVVGNDDRWRNVVTWVIYATFYAEELGINQKNYTTFKDSKNSDISRFLGTTDSLGIELGLAPDWTTQILKAVGNYNDIYERNLAPLEIPRGLNRSWKQGGLIYAMPFR